MGPPCQEFQAIDAPGPRGWKWHEFGRIDDEVYYQGGERAFRACATYIMRAARKGMTRWELMHSLIADGVRYDRDRLCTSFGTWVPAEGGE